MRTPPIGFPLQFFPCADKSVDPIAAMVTQIGMNGMVKLSLFFPGGGEHKSSGEFVRHISDPWVKENKYTLMKSRGGVQRGAWDWVPGIMYDPPLDEISPRQLSEEAEESRKSAKREEGLLKVDALAAEGLDPEQIVKGVRTYGLSRQDVLDHVNRQTVNA